MTKIRQFYRGDFSVDVTFISKQGESVTPRPVPFHVKIEYFTECSKVPYVVERNGEDMLNCSISDDGMTLTAYLQLSRKDIGVGELRYISTEYEDNDAYPNGVRAIPSLGTTSILLWRGQSDEVNVIIHENIIKTGTPALVIDWGIATASAESKSLYSRLIASPGCSIMIRKDGGYITAGTQIDNDTVIVNGTQVAESKDDIILYRIKISSAGAIEKTESTLAHIIDNVVADKQGALISGKNIKTVGGQSILGSGDLLIPPTTEIWYTSVDGEVIEPHAADAFGANIVSNTYENGKGVIVFDGDVTMIGFSAFSTNINIISRLTSIVIPNSVTKIEYSAFRNCASLKSITIPEGVTSIGMGSFEGCSSLTSIVIPNSVTEIKDGAFENCTSLKSITIPEGVTSIGSGTLSGCSSLASINGSRFLVVKGVLKGFAPIGNLSISIPDGVTSIENYTFSHLSLTNVIIPESVTLINQKAFEGCTGEVILNSINIPANRLSNSWLGYSEFSKVTIGESVKTIGKDILGDFSGELVIKSKALVEKNYTVRTIPSKFDWLMGAQISKITIASPITTIGNAVFRGLTSLKEVTIEDSVTSINTSSFYGCTGLLSIGNSAFRGCTALSSVTLPEGVTSVGSTVFEGCSRLEKVLFPSTTTSIGNSVVGSSVRAFCCTATTPPTLSNSLSYLHKNCVVVVPKGALDTYKVATNWSVKAGTEKMAGSELLEYFDNELFWVLVRMELKVQNSVLGSIIS